MRKKHPRRTFSEAFKREKVRKLELGQTTVKELVRTYGMHRSVIYVWKNKYGNLPKDERIVLEKGSEYLKSIELEKQIKTLENLVGRQQMMLDYYSQVIKHANVNFKTDIEKKFGSK